jgi:LysM repeat protein
VSTGIAVLVLTSMAAITALVLGPLATPAAATSTTTRPALATIVVHPGETLWSIANRVAPNADPRETITALREVNNLPSADVYPGEQLVVPASH